MKRINYFLVCAMLLIGTSTVVLAQNHRHSQRNDSTEQVILDEAGENEIGGEEWNVADIDDLVDSKVNEALKKTDRPGWIVRHADENEGWVAAIAILSVFAVFMGPAVLLAIILYFIYKRKKSRDAVVMEALKNGREIPYGYGGTSTSAPRPVASNAQYSASGSQRYEDAPKYSRFADQPEMHAGIKKVAIGLGMNILGSYLHVSLLGGIGWFIAIYGIGQIVIGYLSKGKEPEIKNAPKTETKAEPKTETKPESATEVPTESEEEPKADVIANEDEKPE